MNTDLDIIFEDDQILLVNKPGGLGTQAPRDFDSVEARVRDHLASTGPPDRMPYLGIPHRLDRCASGVIVFAKRKKAAQRLSKQFELREVSKTYVAMVAGHVETTSGEWRDHMRKVPDEPRAEMVPAEHEDAKLAVLQFQVISANDFTTRLQIELETGRMHQIRVQCAARDLPVIGDEMYGSPTPFGPPFEHDRERWIALHASHLGFEHPKTRERVQFEASLPSYWDQVEHSK